MSAIDGNGTSRPSTDSYHVQAAWPQPHDRHESPSSPHARAVLPDLAAAARERLGAGAEGDRHETEVRDGLGGRAVRVQREKAAPRDAHDSRCRGDAADPPQWSLATHDTLSTVASSSA